MVAHLNASNLHTLLRAHIDIVNYDKYTAVYLSQCKNMLIWILQGAICIFSWDSLRELKCLMKEMPPKQNNNELMKANILNTSILYEFVDDDIVLYSLFF